MQTFFIKFSNYAFWKIYNNNIVCSTTGYFFPFNADNCLILLFTPTANYETTCYLTISFCIVSTVLSFVCLFLQLITMAEVD